MPNFGGLVRFPNGSMVCMCRAPTSPWMVADYHKDDHSRMWKALHDDNSGASIQKLASEAIRTRLCVHTATRTVWSRRIWARIIRIQTGILRLDSLTPLCRSCVATDVVLIVGPRRPRKCPPLGTAGIQTGALGAITTHKAFHAAIKMACRRKPL